MKKKKKREKVTKKRSKKKIKLEKSYLKKIFQRKREEKLN